MVFRTERFRLGAAAATHAAAVALGESGGGKGFPRLRSGAPCSRISNHVAKDVRVGDSLRVRKQKHTRKHQQTQLGCGAERI